MRATIQVQIQKFYQLVKRNRQANTICISSIFCFLTTLYPLKSMGEPVTIQMPSTDHSRDSNPPKINLPISANSSGVDDERKHGIGLGLGETFLMGDFEKHGEDKITWDLLYTYNASRTFDLLIDFHTSTHTSEEDQSKLRAYVLALKGRAYQFDSFSPYYVVGSGFYRPSISQKINGKQEESKHKYVLGFNAGAGAELNLNPMLTVGMIFHFHRPFEIKSKNSPEVSGGYYKLLITLVYHFNLF